MNDAQRTEMLRGGYWFAVFSTVSAGAGTVVGKWNLMHISPLLMNCLIFSIATFIISTTVMPKRRFRGIFDQTRAGWFWLSMFTLSSLLAVWFFWTGVQKMDPSLAAFLNRAEVLVAIFLGIIFLKERFNRLETFGALLSIAGIVIMRLTLRMEYTSGFFYVMMGSLFFGTTEFMSKMAVKHVEPVVMVYLRNMVMALVFWLVFLIGTDDFGGLAVVWPGVLALGILGPIFSRVAYLLALKRLELSKVAVISQSQPVVVLVIALLAFGHLPSIREIAGGLCLTFGCIIIIMARQRVRGTG